MAAALAVSMLAAGCGKRQAKQETAAEEKTQDVVVASESGTIVLDLTGEAGSELKFKVRKESGQTMTFRFHNGEFDHLHATLSSDDEAANVRFTQIIMPDGEADGPFGMEIDYELVKEGEYRLLVNENMMAGDPWEGEFTLEISLSEK
jgi:hypothetical protein